MVPGDTSAFANAVVEALNDSAQLARLKAGAAESGARFTMDNMVSNVERGILSCLEGHTRYEDTARP
jgi:hypothetical protein